MSIRLMETTFKLAYDSSALTSDQKYDFFDYIKKNFKKNTKGNKLRDLGRYGDHDLTVTILAESLEDATDSLNRVIKNFLRTKKGKVV